MPRMVSGPGVWAERGGEGRTATHGGPSALSPPFVPPQIQTPLFADASSTQSPVRPKVLLFLPDCRLQPITRGDEIGVVAEEASRQRPRGQNLIGGRPKAMAVWPALVAAAVALSAAQPRAEGKHPSRQTPPPLAPITTFFYHPSQTVWPYFYCPRIQPLFCCQ